MLVTGKITNVFAERLQTTLSYEVEVKAGITFCHGKLIIPGVHLEFAPGDIIEIKVEGK